MKIKFIDKEQDWANETTRYWFDVDGEDYCIADQNGDLTLLDCDGCPIQSEEKHTAQGNAKKKKKKTTLIGEREKHMND